MRFALECGIVYHFDYAESTSRRALIDGEKKYSPPRETTKSFVKVTLFDVSDTLKPDMLRVPP